MRMRKVFGVTVIIVLPFQLIGCTLAIPSVQNPTTIPPAITRSTTTNSLAASSPPTAASMSPATAMVEPLATTAKPATTTQFPTTTKSPDITIALDYFGIRNTHWVSQYLGGPEAEVQLVIVISDNTGVLDLWPPNPEHQTFSMDFFQVDPLKDFNGGSAIFYKGPVSGPLSIRVEAYNVNKGPITKADIDLLKLLGVDFTQAKQLIPDKEFIGKWWQTWLPINNWGVGNQFTNADPQNNADLKIWGRIGTSSQIPAPIHAPVLKPNVKIESVKLPTNAKVGKTIGYFFYSYASDFSFTIANYESFTFPIYWHLETTANPGTSVDYLVYPTSGTQYVSANGGKFTINAKYWFPSPGKFQWTYVLADASGNTRDSWTGILLVSP